jgi:hypothetical protein
MMKGVFRAAELGHPFKRRIGLIKRRIELIVGSRRRSIHAVHAEAPLSTT